jgi:hypothetical protein
MRSPHEVRGDDREVGLHEDARERGVMEIQKTIDDLLLDPSKYQKVRDFAREHGYFMSRAVQHVSDVMAWTGAYDHAIERGAERARGRPRSRLSGARDSGQLRAGRPVAVRDSVAVHPDVLALLFVLQREGESVADGVQHTIRDLGMRKGAGRLLYVYTFGFMIPAVLGHAIKQLATGEQLVEDDEGPMHAMFRLFFGSQFDMATRMVPSRGRSRRPQLAPSRRRRPTTTSWSRRRSR